MKVILGFYFASYIHLLIHELSHALSAIIMRIGLKEVKIGANIFNLRIGKMSISPIIGGGYVEVYQDELLKKSYVQIVAFFESGAWSNLISAIVVEYCFCNIYADIYWMVGVMLFLLNHLVIKSESDISNMVYLIKKRRKMIKQ